MKYVFGQLSQIMYLSPIHNFLCISSIASKSLNKIDSNKKLNIYKILIEF